MKKVLSLIVRILIYSNYPIPFYSELLILSLAGIWTPVLPVRSRRHTNVPPCFFTTTQKNLFYFPQHFLKSFVEAFSWSSLEALLKNKIQSSTCVFNKDKPFNFIPKHNINAFKIKILSKFKVQNTFFFKVKLAFYALCFTPTCK